MKRGSFILFVIAISSMVPVAVMAAGKIQVEGVVKKYVPSEKLVITDNSGREEKFVLTASTSHSGTLEKGTPVIVAASGNKADAIKAAPREIVYSTDSIPTDIYPPHLGSATD